MPKSRKYVAEDGSYLDIDDRLHGGFHRIAWFLPEDDDFGAYVGDRDVWSNPQEDEDSDPKTVWELKTADEAVKPFAYGKDSSSGYQFESEKDARNALRAANEALLKGSPLLKDSPPEREEMSLDEFLAEMRRDMDTFERSWKKNAEKTPEQWPLKMKPGDWYDQFIIFESSGEKD